jgi:hypothetical protein
VPRGLAAPSAQPQLVVPASLNVQAVAKRRTWPYTASCVWLTGSTCPSAVHRIFTGATTTCQCNMPRGVARVSAYILLCQMVVWCDTCRKQHQSCLAEREAKFAAGYGRLVAWQQDMVASGVQHTDTSLHHLLRALDRFNQVCAWRGGLVEGWGAGDWLLAACWRASWLAWMLNGAWAAVLLLDHLSRVCCWLARKLTCSFILVCS